MGKMFVVPTPIGNLEDITMRALRILEEVDFIMAEDTRKTGMLLKHFNISTKTYSHHKFNEHNSAQGVISRLDKGETCALVSDAGTPAISDPGFLLVRLAIEEGHEVESLPGATAFVPALVNSGLPSEKFCFEGFLPHKKGRQTRLTEIAEEKRTVILYESPHRLLKTLNQLADFCGGERKASVSREISKMHEENVRGSISELIQHFTEKSSIKGEIVIVLSASNYKN